MWEKTGEKPPALTDRPELELVWQWPYRVWQELSGSRRYYQGTPAQIAFSEVALYGITHGGTKASVAELWRDVHTIDKAWQAEVSKISEDQS